MVTMPMDLNAGYCCYHGLCCFYMIRSEGPEALVAIEAAHRRGWGCGERAEGPAEMSLSLSLMSHRIGYDPYANTTFI